MSTPEPTAASPPAVPELPSTPTRPPVTAPASSAPPQSSPAEALNALWGHLPWSSPQGNTAARGSTATDGQSPAWLSGASALLSDAVQGAGAAVAAAGEKLRAVDQGALEGGIESLRVASDQLVRDVSQGVKELTTPSRGAESEAEGTRVTPAALLETLRAGTREALELFVDAAPGTQHTASGPPVPAPWDEGALPERERPYANALRERMLKLVVDAIYSRSRREALFLSGRAKKDGFSFDAQRELNRALAVLDADPNVKRLRAGLVPAKIPEREFWDEYFWHVRHARRLLVAHDGVFPEEETTLGGAGVATELFGKEDEEEMVEEAEKEARKKIEAEKKVESEVQGEKKGETEGEGVRNWDDEIDAIFDPKGSN